MFSPDLFAEIVKARRRPSVNFSVAPLLRLLLAPDPTADVFPFHSALFKF